MEDAGGVLFWKGLIGSCSATKPVHWAPLMTLPIPFASRPVSSICQVSFRCIPFSLSHCQHPARSLLLWYLTHVPALASNWPSAFKLAFLVPSQHSNQRDFSNMNIFTYRPSAASITVVINFEFVSRTEDAPCPACGSLRMLFPLLECSPLPSLCD